MRVGQILVNTNEFLRMAEAKVFFIEFVVGLL